MAYTAKTWVDNSAPSVCAANLNDLETGVADAHTTADKAVAKGVLQAKGDLIAALSASSPTRVVAGADDTVLVADSAQTHGLKWVQIGNAQVLAAAAIAYSKLNLASSIVNADVAAGAAIAKSKLAALAISDSDVAAGAAIAYSKLALAGSIVNADIASSASISAPKIAGFPADSAKFLRGDATWAAPAGGTEELSYDSVTSGDISVTATTEGAAITLVTASAYTFDGTAVIIEAWFPGIKLGAAGVQGCYGALYEDGSSIGYLSYMEQATGPTFLPGWTLRRRLTPTAASHTYSIRAFVTSGTATVRTGAGGAGAHAPGYIRIKKAA